MKVTNKNIKSVINSHIDEHGSDVNLNHLDVSNVTDMNGLFAYSDFNGDISSWNVGNVSNMSCMFSHCTKFNSDISSWNVSRVTDMTDMFAHCTIFNSDISSWNVSNVTDMTDMFKYNNFERVDILKEYFNGIIPKGKIIDILKDKYPENFI